MLRDRDEFGRRKKTFMICLTATFTSSLQYEKDGWGNSVESKLGKSRILKKKKIFKTSTLVGSNSKENDAI